MFSLAKNSQRQSFAIRNCQLSCSITVKNPAIKEP